MLSICLNGLISTVNEYAKQTDDTYKLLFYTLLGIIMLSAAAFLIYKKRKKLSLLFDNAVSFLKKTTSKAYASLKGMLTRPLLGFAYSKEQDIFYSTINAWQRSFGYSRLYDEAAAHFGMIADSEPVYFDYDGKRWLIEFWKGQYGMTTGCEVGIYNTKRPDFSISGVFNDTFFDSARDEDMLFISFTLYKNGRELFNRQEKHWWLTGFKLGMFSKPSELVMKISLTLKDKTMLHAFLGGIRNTGYSNSEVAVNGKTVSFVFSKPRSLQPHSRTKEIEDFMQGFNRQNCDIFQALTGDYTSTASKLAVLRKKEPTIFNNLLDFGGSKRILKKHGRLQH